MKQASAVFGGHHLSAGQFPANFRLCPWLQGYARLSQGFSQGYPQLLWVKIPGSAKDRNSLKLLAYD
jgi:hypothetical protein